MSKPKERPKKVRLEVRPQAVMDLPDGSRLSIQPLEAHLERIREEAHQVIKPEAVDRWLMTPQRFLGGRTPLQAIEQGNGDLVYATLVALKEGAHV